MSVFKKFENNLIIVGLILLFISFYFYSGHKALSQNEKDISHDFYLTHKELAKKQIVRFDSLERSFDLLLEEKDSLTDADLKYYSDQHDSIFKDWYKTPQITTDKISKHKWYSDLFIGIAFIPLVYGLFLKIVRKA